MKMIYKMCVMPCVYLFSFLFAITASARQKAVKTQLVDSITLEGKILDSAILKMPNKETEVVVTVSKYPFNSVLMQNTIHHTYKLNIGHNTKFRFVLPVLADRFYMQLGYVGNPRVSPFGSIDNIYIMERGDKINFVLTTKMFTFSGKGSARLNCQSELSKAIIPLKNWAKLYSRKEFDLLAFEQNKLLDSCLTVQKGIVKKYNRILGKDLSAIMLANCYGMRYFTTLWGYRNQADNLGFYNGFINSAGYKEIESNSKLNIDPTLIVQSPVYTDFLFEKTMMQTRLFVNGEIEENNSPKHMLRTYNAIITNYSGVIRDKLIAAFFIHWQTQPTIMDYMEKSILLMRESGYKQILFGIAEKNLKGQPFYPFELEDSGGKIVKLQDLNNKVVIVDFWYTGCPGCINLKRAMEGVWETYKNNTNVAFVSISIDKDKDEWKKSILTKIYTEPTSINLYTGGEGKEHQIIKNLEIVAYPRMYLLKNGKLYSANTPWPSGPDTTKGTTKEYIDLIARAINAK